VSVAYLVSEHRAFAADITPSGHNVLLFSSLDFQSLKCYHKQVRQIKNFFQDFVFKVNKNDYTRLEQEMEFTKDTLIADVLKNCPGSVDVFDKFNMGCVSCAGIANESLAKGCAMHGVNVETFLTELKAFIDSKC